MEAGLDTALMFSGNNEQAVMRHTVRWSSYRADLFMSSTEIIETNTISMI